MEGLKKLVGVYLILVSLVVAVWFAINPFWAVDDPAGVEDLWGIVDWFMAAGLLLGLIFAYIAKREADARYTGDEITRSGLEANVTLYAVAAVSLLFLHNWFSLLAGIELGADNHSGWVLWGLVDTALPITLGVLGCRLLRS